MLTREPPRFRRAREILTSISLAFLNGYFHFTSTKLRYFHVMMLSRFGLFADGRDYADSLGAVIYTRIE